MLHQHPSLGQQLLNQCFAISAGVQHSRLSDSQVTLEKLHIAMRHFGCIGSPKEDVFKTHIQLLVDLMGAGAFLEQKVSAAPESPKLP